MSVVEIFLNTLKDLAVSRSKAAGSHRLQQVFLIPSVHSDHPDASQEMLQQQ